MTLTKIPRPYLSLCLIIAGVVCLPAAKAAASLPHHRITISFDLAKHRLYGIVDATIPKSVQAMTVGGNLRISKFEVNGEITLVKIEKGRINLPAHPDGTRVYLEYEGIFTGSGHGMDENILGDEGGALLADWYPAAEAELAYFSLQARLPSGFHAVSEADTTITKEIAKDRLAIFGFPHPVSHISFVMARYVVNKERYRSVELATYLFPEDQSLSDRYLDYTKRYLEMYEDMLGPYPFRRFAVVENVLPTGYGMPTFTLLGRQVLKLPFIPETSLGHEILHSWFGNSVYVDYENGNWSEGLTSYLADHYYDENKGKGWQYRKKILENYESYVQADNEIPVRDFSSGGARPVRAVGYGKTAMIFHMLNNRIGKKAFSKALGVLVRQQRFRVTSWQDLERIFSKSAGRDLSGFFELWLGGTGAMGVSLNRIRVNRIGQDYQLEFAVRVTNSPTPVNVPVVIQTEEGREKQVLSVATAEQNFIFSLNTKPEEIIVDPDYDLFRSLKLAERSPLLSRLLGDPTRTFVLPEANQHVYASLSQELRSRDFESVTAKEVNHSNLGQKAFLFLGPQPQLKSFFPWISETPEGFSIQIWKNVLNPKLVLGLVLAENEKEVTGVGEKLFHYGNYSRLKFTQGKNVEKETQESDRGIHLEVPEATAGISLDTVLSLPEIISRIADKTIIYAGEKHDRYGDHLMQFEVIKNLHQRHSKLAIGMEMFQRRYQKALDDYIFGETDELTFLKQSHYFSTWRFNYHLYRDILQYAREHGIPVVALNQDHELVSKVADKGLEKLSRKEKARIPKEMAFDDEPYKKRLQSVFEMHQRELPGDSAPRAFEYFHQAQILWDETMAESIATFLVDRPDYQLVVLAGSGHLAYGSGIPKRAHRRIGSEYAIVLPNPEEPLESELADYIVFPSEAEAPAAAKLGVMIETAENELTVVSFIKVSGAKEAGMEKGDIILAVDGQKVEDIEDLQAYLGTKYVDDEVRVKVRRDQSTVELKVKLGSSARHGG
jgi:uncharacterized iron-regulated protein